MTEAHHRKKDPEQVRRQLLTAIGSLASERGSDAITIEAVARRAGVSKGGLLHHFPSRTALLDALFEELWTRFHNRLAIGLESDDEPVGRVARAYLGTCNPAPHEDDEQLWNIVGVVMMGVAEFRDRWVKRCREEAPCDDDGDDVETQARMLICRLAADGLWLNDVLGLYHIAPTLRREIMKQLADATRPRGGRT